jgi:hypothetical protein
MEIILWVVGIHLLELLGFGIFLLIKKNILLEKTLVEQKEYMDAMSFIASQLSTSLAKLDERMYVEGDAELEEVFEQIKEFKSIIDEVSNK